MNIVLISSVLNYRTLAGALSKHRVHQIMPEGDTHMAVEMRELDRLSPEYGRNLVVHRLKRFFLLGYLRESYAIAKREDVDLLWATSPTLGFICLILKVLLKKPYFILVGQPYTEYILQERPFYYRIFLPLYEVIMFIAFRNADAVITHSRYLQDYVRKHGARNIVATYYYGVDTETFKPLKTSRQGKFTIMYAGRFSAQKGISHLMEAFRMLKERGLDFKVWMYGQGPLKETVLNATSGNMLDVQVQGYLDEKSLALKMNEADVFVVPSITEGLGFIAAEAVSCGLPVVASNVGGLPDSVEGYGLLVPPANPTAIADAILEVQRNYGFYRRRALEGRSRIIEKFDRKRVVTEFQDALESIVNANRAF